jgi:hypothetical protein
MTLPTWPIQTYAPQADSMKGGVRMLEPIETPMQGGNVRMRSQPGDNVGQVSQVVRMSMADHDIFVDWVKTTLSNGTGRFTAQVWLGSAFVNKVCQFVKGGGGIKYDYSGVDFVDVAMTLRVYDV